MKKGILVAIIMAFVLFWPASLFYTKLSYSSALETFPAPENFYKTDERVVMIGDDGSWGMKEYRTDDKEIDFESILIFYENWAKTNGYTVVSRRVAKTESYVQMPQLLLKNKMFNRAEISLQIEAPKVHAKGSSYSYSLTIFSDDIREYVAAQTIPEGKDHFWTIKFFIKE